MCVRSVDFGDTGDLPEDRPAAGTGSGCYHCQIAADRQLLGLERRGHLNEAKSKIYDKQLLAVVAEYSAGRSEPQHM